MGRRAGGVEDGSVMGSCFSQKVCGGLSLAPGRDRGPPDHNDFFHKASRAGCSPLCYATARVSRLPVVGFRLPSVVAAPAAEERSVLLDGLAVDHVCFQTQDFGLAVESCVGAGDVAAALGAGVDEMLEAVGDALKNLGARVTEPTVS